MDVGGTFTDCLAVAPDGQTTILKVLSSGHTKTEIIGIEGGLQTKLQELPTNFYRGYRCQILAATGQVLQSATITHSNAQGQLALADVKIDSGWVGLRCELSSSEGAPLVAIRRALHLRLDEPIPPVMVRLGTTRGTNALLTRRGARTGFVTTRGFRDVLRIANQDRPRLFDLAIQKPTPLFHSVAEIDERLAADGTVLQSPSPEQIRLALAELKSAGCESLAICLLHAFANPVHEEQVATIATEMGWQHVSVSTQLSPLIKIVPRGETTVVDAYLNPVLRDYVAQLQTALPGSDLKFMTSSGGLVTAERFTGKESVLSGPAGGVIGFSRAATQAGFTEAIGFDMGGTSTDVARYAGRLEYEFETLKAGVRIVTPMLSIETVAAGGGSLCGFDGVKLFVGPDSAGSDPGPACYGRGGPLTVTDCNVFLGRVPPSCFPFALDQAAIAQRLAALIPLIEQSPLGRRYTPEDLAAGYLEIANATMARAIRNVSIAKGYEPAAAVLVPFGGAGGQHACALAAELGMTQILAHPWAGVLSAYGIGLADVRRFRQQSVLEPFTSDSRTTLSPLIDRMIDEATTEVLADGVPRDRIAPPLISFDLRYKGVETTLNIIEPTDGDFAAEYARQHQQLYGYVRHGRPIEIAAIRVEIIGRGAHTLQRSETVAPLETPPPSDAQHRMYLHGQWTPAPIVRRVDLQPGHHITGPAIIAESTSTLVIDPGFTARVLSQGEIVISRSPGIAIPGLPSAPTSAVTTTIDPVQLELFHQTFTSIAEQMGVTLQQTSVSTNVKERLDFSCALFDSQGGLVVNAPHIPVHLGAMGETVRCILRDNPHLAPGDVFVTNDPYRGGSHLPDVTVITPVHDPDTQQLLFLTASRAHHAEIGGIVPGSMPPFSKNLGEEGVLIRNFRLIHASESHEDELETLLQTGRFPSRNVPDNLADVRAQVAANQRGVQLLLKLVADRGRETVLAYMRHLQDAAAAAMRQALRTIPNGDYRFTDHLDDGSPIHVTITIHEDAATIDFTGTGPVLPTNLNANRAIVTAAVMYGLRCLIQGLSVQGSVFRAGQTILSGPQPLALSPQLPLNGGVLKPITIVLPECLLNPPEHADPALCPAMVGGNVETSQRIVDVLLGALGLAAASQGTMNNLTFGDSTFGYYETICGGSGATSYADGADAVHTHMTNTRLTDPEIIERRYPVRLREFTIRTGSGGAGHYRGGDGVKRVIEFLRPVRLSLLTERRGQFAPYGLHGGQPGQTGINTLTHTDGQTINLGGKASLEVAEGDVLTLETPGGGGCGLRSLG